MGDNRTGMAQTATTFIMQLDTQTLISFLK